MKKVLFTILSMTLLSHFTFGQITVSGSGCTASACFAPGTPIDDTYTQSGTDGSGRKVYNSSGNQIVIQFNIGANQWEIRDCIGTVYYTNSNATTPNPPDTDWGGAANDCIGNPAPTLSGDVTVLPVELIFFEARIFDERITLSWLTASEINNEKFEIEKSQDGREFRKIGEVKGNGTTLEEQEYSFKVENPRNGTSYYRLKQIDFDGQFEYSEVISVDFKGKNGNVGEFYPNPSKSGMVNLDYTSQNDEEIIVSVFDMTGKLVVNQIQQVTNGDNNLSFDFSDLNTGIYIVKIGDERNPTHRKLIIKR